MILRNDPKTIWKRKNVQGTQVHEIVLTADVHGQVAFKNLTTFDIFELTEDQFFEMLQAGVKYFGKEITINDKIPPCPFCGQTMFDIHTRRGGLFHKVCTNCGLAGPFSASASGAERLWAEWFDKHNLMVIANER